MEFAEIRLNGGLEFTRLSINFAASLGNQSPYELLKGKLK